ncbi:type II and III secretion system protein [Terrimicrobium sacchariphilum]|uniref:Type II and III secretion system protein n=1 Tax=Terrimicrobium sacchariphilum TaxID=690879 RepID=A0A146G8A3_TERSA|nr:type II and III secretion system protein [Terrimicrobium sacchariphilum]
MQSRLLICTVCLLAGLGVAYPGAVDPLKMVEIEVRTLSATKSQAEGLEPIEFPITSDKPSGVTAVLSPEQAAKALDLLKRVGATVASTTRVIALSGKMASVQNVRDFQYPTEYSASKNANSVPTAFESAPVGTIMEFVPELGDGVINLSLTIKLKSLEGFIDCPDPEAPGRSVWQPAFQSNEFKSDLTVTRGQIVFYSAPATEKTNAQFIFITMREVDEP